MSKDEKRRIRKQRKIKSAKIWPSIVFLVLSLHLAALAAVVFIAGVIGYFATERIQTGYNNAATISGMVENADSNDAKWRVINYLKRDEILSSAVYILDENDDVIAGFGGQTYSDGKINILGKDNVYYDKNSKYIMFDEDLNVNVPAVVTDMMSTHNYVKVNLKDIFKFDDKNVAVEEYFWIGQPLSDGSKLMVKCRLWYYTSDIVMALAFGLLSNMVLCIPIIFLFVNVILTARNQHRMTRIIYTDNATGGNSRIYFEQNADRWLYKKRKSGKLYAVVDITMMKYRSYTICHGLAAGEFLLARIDSSIKKMLGRNEICARHERADFALLLEVKDRENCEKRVGDMLCKLPDMLGHDGTFVFHAGIYYVRTGKGDGSIADHGKYDIDVTEYFNRASSARSSLSDANQAAFATFDDVLLEKQLWEHKVEERMNKALENEEFKVYIQPKYNPVTEKLSGAEALVRWINDEDGFISPGKFIPIFEENGFIVKLDDYMISHVAALQARWIAEGKNVVPISVNVSRAHFANPNLAEHICGLVDAHGVPHHLIEIELTESAFFDDKAALLSTVGRLHDLGFEVSMDDFGAGYSSLNSLKDLPLDVLKLDAEFFRGEGGEERGEIVVAQAINLAKQLNMRIVAEGVEKKEQVDFLASKDCDMIQGFYFAKPMPADEYRERLEDGEKPSDD